MENEFKKLLDLYPDLIGRDNPAAIPKYKVVARMLDRHLNKALEGKKGVKADRHEELVVTLHTAGQNSLFSIPIAALLEDKEIMTNLSSKDIASINFVYTYDNYMDENSNEKDQ